MNNAPKWLINNPIAHRGLHDGNNAIPENSLSAFAKAITADYPIELDVRLLGDGMIVVFHDSDLNRSCGIPKKLAHLKSEQLKRYLLFNTSETIPTFLDVLEMVAGQVPLLIELKTTAIFNRSLERNLLNCLSNYSGSLALQSFNPFTVKWLQKNSAYPIGQLAERSEAMWPANKIIETIQLNTSQNPDFIGYDIALFPNPSVSYFQKRGVPILAWTVQNKTQHLQKAAYFDNIIFEGFIP